MICILAGNYLEAQRFAQAHGFGSDEWFYPSDIEDLKRRENFHVLVVGSAGENVPKSYFEKIYNIAKERGRRNRK